MKDKDKLGKDKLKHFLVCFALSVISPLVAVGAAIGKEYGDSKSRGNHWCWWDVFWDSLGILVGGSIHYSMVCLLM